MNDVLGTTFAGTMVIEGIGRVGLTGVSGVTVRLRDNEALQVLFVQDATVRLSLLALARSAIFGKGDLAITIDEASLGYVDANLSTNSVAI